jgi:hypothetical protein
MMVRSGFMVSPRTNMVNSIVSRRPPRQGSMPSAGLVILGPLRDDVLAAFRAHQPDAAAQSIRGARGAIAAMRTNDLDFSVSQRIAIHGSLAISGT